MNLVSRGCYRFNSVDSKAYGVPTKCAFERAGALNVTVKHVGVWQQESGKWPRFGDGAAVLRGQRNLM